MSNVVSISEARQSHTQDYIDHAYAALEALPNFRKRDGQPQLSMWIKQSMMEGRMLAAEAPTGTGKTIAYLIGALAASKEYEARGTPMPVVVATATVGLQQQILSGDLPRLIAAGLLDEGDAILAKGRSRYFCIQSAERFVSENDGKSQFDFFNEGENVDVSSIEEIKDALEQYHGRAWNGDVDTFKGNARVFWAKVEASSDTCTSRQCDHYEECPYFAERRKLANAKIAIANHSLVLADMAQAMEEKDAVFPYSRYLLTFDEGHHLPDKAMEIGAARMDFSEVEQMLLKLPLYISTIYRQGEFARFLEAKDIGSNDFRPGPAMNLLRDARLMIAQMDVDPVTFQRRFRGGVVPDDLRSMCTLALQELNSLKDLVGKAINALKSSNMVEKKPDLKPVLADVLYNGSFYNTKLKEFTKSLSLFCANPADQRSVRWVFVNDPVVSVHVSPLEGSDVLKRLVWDNPRARATLVSATIQDFEGFDRFRVRAGLPANARTEALKPIFDYTTSTITMAEMKWSPAAKERERYVEELLERMPRDIDPSEGTLILFSSWTMMKRAVEELRKVHGGLVIAQGDMGFRDLIKEHKARIDAGRGSVLVGVATMAEGLDLPGKYCTHVLITAIPFSVPGTPLEEERAELLGDRYFREHLLPDALVKLVQMVGRLIRTEGDCGRITMYDNRLYAKAFGRDIMKTLPPFKKKREWIVRKPAVQPIPLKAV